MGFERVKVPRSGLAESEGNREEKRDERRSEIP